VVAAAVLLIVAGGVLSATTARTEPAEAVAAPPAEPEEPPAPPAPTAAATTPALPAQRRHPALIARSTDHLGPVVVDAEGYTLYRFDDDTGGDATCTDSCVSTWLPVTVDPAARLRVEGVDDSAVGLIRRREGTYQLTVGGWPLYRFAGDTAPGRTGGHGIGDSWFAISPTGAKAAAP
jgi:predicted lipoprotein with Yx(FWY)xxD motif